VAPVFKTEAPAFELLGEAQAVQAKLIDLRASRCGTCIALA
jgi:hypothetical protein